MVAGYVTTYKFNRTKEQFVTGQFPLVCAYPSNIATEEYIAMPKQKIVTFAITLSGKVTANDGDTLENEILKMDEYLKNALETDLQWSQKITIVNIGTSRFQVLEDLIGETTFDVIISTGKFTVGTR
jgi:hypothetical protein